SAKADILKIGPNTDLSSLQEIDAGEQEGGTEDTLDLSRFGRSTTFAGGKIEGIATEFKGFEKIIGTTSNDKVKIKSGDAGLTFDGGPAKDTADYSQFNKGLTVDLKLIDQQTFEIDGIEITRPVDVASAGEVPALPVDHLKNIETLILTNQKDQLKVGADA